MSDGTDTDLEENQEGQAELEHWREAAKRRAEEETRRAARQRRRLMLISGGVVLALLIGLVAWKVGMADRPRTAGEVALGGKRASVLLQLRSPTGAAAASVVIMHDRGNDTGGLLAIPRDLVVDVPGAGVLPFGESLVSAGESLSRDGLADLLGATIHGSFTFDPDTFAAVINRLGGVEMPITHPIVIKGATVVEPAAGGGPVRLRGEWALAYAITPVPGETTAIAAERFAAVVRALLARIPSQFEVANYLLAAVGVVGNGTMPPAQLAAILAGAAADLRAETLSSATLPIRPDGSGIIEATEAGPIVRSVLGGTVQSLSGSGTPRVMLQVGSASERIREAARAAILNAGFRYVDGGRAPGSSATPVARTTIVTYGREGEAAGRALAIALGLDPQIVKSAEGAGVADVVVVLGSDYQPAAARSAAR